MIEYLMTHPLILYLFLALPIAVFATAAICAASDNHQTDDEDKLDYAEAVATYRTHAIIAEVRRQQWRARSRNRHLIVGQEFRRIKQTDDIDRMYLDSEVGETHE